MTSCTTYCHWIVLAVLWCWSHGSPDVLRVVKMLQNMEKKDFVFTDFVLQSVKAGSFLQCARVCVEKENSLSLTFWPQAAALHTTCVCYGVKPYMLSSPMPAPKARCYTLHGRTGVDCGAAPDVLHALASSAGSGQVGEEVRYSCQPGYRQTAGGNGTRTCGMSGLWQRVPADTDPVCSAVSCGQPPSVTSATASTTSTGYYGDQVTYSCSHGYSQSGGTGRRYCAASGTWEANTTDSDPVCTPVACGQPPTLPSAVVSSSSVGYYGSQVTYSCEPGYTHSGGSGTRECAASGLWELDTADTDPVCTAVTCGQPPSVSSATASSTNVGVYGNQVTYSCNAGYSQSGGTGRRQCATSGTWEMDSTDTDPVCTPVTCGQPPSVSSATASSTNVGVYGNQVTYTCNTGYSQSGGTGRRQCAASGTWEIDSTDTDPVCTPVTCGQPPAMSSATASSTDVGVYGNQVTYSCNPGYSQSGGTGRRQCAASGTWEMDSTDTDPVCTPQTCGGPPTVHGAAHWPSQSTFHTSDVITFVCTGSFEKNGGGNGERICSSSGTWQQQRPDPVCVLDD